jgi:hypothetical protein
MLQCEQEVVRIDIFDGIHNEECSSSVKRKRDVIRFGFIWFYKYYTSNDFYCTKEINTHVCIDSTRKEGTSFKMNTVLIAFGFNHVTSR